QYLSYDYVPAPNSIYKGISKLPAAHIMVVENGEVRTRRYWNMSWSTASSPPYARREVDAAVGGRGGSLLPDVIMYPTGGGTGLIGMWKAFDEMQQMGWIGAKRPRMISVQSTTCAPIVRAFEKGERFADEFENAATVASGLRVPKAIGDFLILDALRASGGTAIAVTDDELVAAVGEIGAATGIFCAPEGAACLPALRKLIDKNLVHEGESVVLFNTGSGVKYLEALD
ncbi:MAG: pyridoxal-phosphate dependent enzyme, partial [Pyrinomonadaceae bacterium]